MAWRVAARPSTRLIEGGKDVVRRIGLPVARAVWNVLPEPLLYPRPRWLGVALSRLCNANCSFCAYQFLPEADRMVMPDDLFDEVVRRVGEVGIVTVHLSPNLGEPLVAPGFLEKIDSLRRAGVEQVLVTTNGILLDRFDPTEFLERGPDQIAISTSAFDEAVYERVFRNHHYQRVRRNILELLRANSARPLSGRRRIELRIRADIPKDEFLAAPDMAEVMRLADEVSYNAFFGDWGGLVTQEMLTGNMAFRPAVPKSTRPCRQLFTLAVHPDGEILACACQNVHHDPELFVGTIEADDLGRAFERLRVITAAWRSGRLPKTCQSCSMYNDPAAAWQGVLLGRLGFRVGAGSV